MTQTRCRRCFETPDDDYLVALAFESGAEAIVSGDLDLHETTGLPVEILTPREALTRLAG